MNSISRWKVSETCCPKPEPMVLRASRSEQNVSCKALVLVPDVQKQRKSREHSAPTAVAQKRL